MAGIIHPKIIGGLFGLQIQSVDCETFPTFLLGNNVYTANGRSSVFILAQILSPKTIWFPSYLCDVLIKAIKNISCNIRFFEIGQDLTVTSMQWINEINPGDLVILIDYFGFPVDQELICSCQKKKAFVLQDSSQALLTKTEYLSDFVLFSPRKYLGIPDGGIIKINTDIELSQVTLENPPAKWFLGMLETSISRRMFDLGLGGGNWFSEFQKYEREAPIGLYKMSELSYEMLFNSYDYPFITKRRRENYKYLAERLGNIALFPGEIPDDVTPLGYPVLLENRDLIRSALFEKEIFPPIHWDIDDVVPVEFQASHKLSDMILTIPCDQRYDLGDMEYVVSALNKLISDNAIS